MRLPHKEDYCQLLACVAEQTTANQQQDYYNEDAILKNPSSLAEACKMQMQKPS